MAIPPAPSYRGRSYTPPLIQAAGPSQTGNDTMAAIRVALASAQGNQLFEFLAAELKANKFIGLPQVMAHDFDLSDGARDIMYVTIRMGPRQELVFKIGPQTLMRHAIDRCLDTWRKPNGQRFMGGELVFHMPDNNKINYYEPRTAAELGIENHDLIDVFTWSYGG